MGLWLVDTRLDDCFKPISSKFILILIKINKYNYTALINLLLLTQLTANLHQIKYPFYLQFKQSTINL